MEANIKYFDELWKSKKKSKGDEALFWDSRAEAFNSKDNKNDIAKRVAEIKEFLAGQGFQTKDSSILDIGCGPGKYALEFSKEAKAVLGIDISPKMIDFAKDNSKKIGSQNTSFEVMDFNKTKIDEHGMRKKYDLVFASMSPAVNSKDSLDKIIEASKGYCFMSNFVFRKDEIKDWILESIENPDLIKVGPEKIDQNTNKGFSSHGINTYCCFNILWNLGYFPEIKYNDLRWEDKMTMAEAFTYYKSFLGLTEEMDNIKDEILTKCLEKIQTNGVVHERVKSKIAWIAWKTE